MEIHHHGHVHHKSKWKEYLFQFFMLFLAVFCGYLAEYNLEQRIERHREHQYIKSLVNDLKADTANAASVIRSFRENTVSWDTLMISYTDFLKGNSEVFLRNLTSLDGFEDFHVTDGTMQQLKNSGGLRLIRNVEMRDSILRYDIVAKDVLQQGEWMTQVFIQRGEIERKFFDKIKFDSLVQLHGDDFAYKNAGYIFTSRDRQQQVEYYTTLKSNIVNFKYWIRKLSTFKDHGQRLIELLEKKYHLD